MYEGYFMHHLPLYYCDAYILLPNGSVYKYINKKWTKIKCPKRFLFLDFSTGTTFEYDGHCNKLSQHLGLLNINFSLVDGVVSSTPVNLPIINSELDNLMNNPPLPPSNIRSIYPIIDWTLLQSSNICVDAKKGQVTIKNCGYCSINSTLTYKANPSSTISSTGLTVIDGEAAVKEGTITTTNQQYTIDSGNIYALVFQNNIFAYIVVHVKGTNKIVGIVGTFCGTINPPPPATGLPHLPPLPSSCSQIT